MGNAKVHVDMSMSLDGFIAGPNESPENPLGEGGDRLHEWAYPLASWRAAHGLSGGTTGPESDMLEKAIARSGAVIMGRRMFDAGEVPWGDNPPFHVLVFVLTHHAREKLVKEGGTTFTFVTEGIESALEQAKTAAGDKDISLAGGANVFQQFLAAGLVDDLQLHLAPILLGGGIRFFDERVPAPVELDTTGVIESSGVTHVRFRIRR